MKKVLVSLFTGAFIASVLVLNFSNSTSSASDATSYLLFNDVEALTRRELEDKWIKNPGPGDSERRVMPVRCQFTGGGVGIVTGCCPGWSSCSYNPCKPDEEIKGC